MKHVEFGGTARERKKEAVNDLQLRIERAKINSQGRMDNALDFRKLAWNFCSAPL